MSISIYECKDGRMRVYIKETQKVMSYPKYLMEQELGRPLLPNEEVHHRDENPLNNAIDNLQVRLHGEHQAEHATKYYDTTAICGWCGKEFLWTGARQRKFYGNRRDCKNFSEKPFCSRQCSGKYGKSVQVQGLSSRRELSEDQVNYVKTHYISHDHDYGARALASRFGVNRTVIDRIVRSIQD